MHPGGIKFETSWNYRGNMKTMSLKHASWRYLKRFEITEKT